MTKRKSERALDPCEDLLRAVLTLETVEDCRKFFKDITTPAEAKALAERWHVARLLDEGELSYREIHDQTGVSTTTITRVARFLGQEPNQGYRLVLDRMKGSRAR